LKGTSVRVVEQVVKIERVAGLSVDRHFGATTFFMVFSIAGKLLRLVRSECSGVSVAICAIRVAKPCVLGILTFAQMINPMRLSWVKQSWVRRSHLLGLKSCNVPHVSGDTVYGFCKPCHLSHMRCCACKSPYHNSIFSSEHVSFAEPFYPIADSGWSVQRSDVGAAFDMEFRPTEVGDSTSWAAHSQECHVKYHHDEEIFQTLRLQYCYGRNVVGLGMDTVGHQTSTR